MNGTKIYSAPILWGREPTTIKVPEKMAAAVTVWLDTTL